MFFDEAYHIFCIELIRRNPDIDRVVFYVKFLL